MHRDVKSENFLVDEHMICKVCGKKSIFLIIFQLISFLKTNSKILVKNFFLNQKLFFK